MRLFSQTSAALALFTTLASASPFVGNELLPLKRATQALEQVLDFGPNTSETKMYIYGQHLCLFVYLFIPLEIGYLP
jgi:hypothetical protein